MARAHPIRVRRACAPRTRRLVGEWLEGRALLAGDLAFVNSLGSTSSDIVSSVAVDSAGNAVVTGRFAGTVDFDPGPGVTNLVTGGSSDIFIAKYSPTGA